MTVQFPSGAKSSPMDWHRPRAARAFITCPAVHGDASPRWSQVANPIDIRSCRRRLDKRRRLCTVAGDGGGGMLLLAGGTEDSVGKAVAADFCPHVHRRRQRRRREASERGSVTVQSVRSGWSRGGKRRFEHRVGRCD
jgi:hypothetical protein